MTRTETDLRAVFAARADAAPHPDAVLARVMIPTGQKARGEGHRGRLVLAAAAVVVTLAGGAAGAAWLRSDRSAPADAGGPVAAATTAHTASALLTVALDASHPAHGFGVQNPDRSLTRETIVFDRDRAAGAIAGTPDSVDAVLYAPGAFDPTTVRTGTKVQINGRTGWFGPALGRVIAADGTQTEQLTPSVAWQPTGTSWLVVHGVHPGDRTESTALAVARSLRLHPAAVRLPVRFGYLPAPLTATAISSDPLMPGATVTFTSSGPRLTVQVGHVEHQSLRAIFGTDRAPTSVAGHPARLTGHDLTVVLDRYVVFLHGNAQVSPAELRRVATTLTYAPDAANPARWFPAREALP